MLLFDVQYRRLTHPVNKLLIGMFEVQENCSRLVECAYVRGVSVIVT